MVESEFPVSCLLCEQAEWKIHFEDVPDYLTGEKFSVLECRACGFRQTYPMPLQAGKHYPTAYRQYYGLICRLLEFFYRRRVQSWVRYFDGPGRVLEVGCGNGFMLTVLKRCGWQVSGIERTSEIAREVSERTGIPVYAGELHQIPESEKYDLIILFQVLEHLENPLPLLRECRRRLAPGGRVVVGVPNCDSWQAEFSQEMWFHLDVPRHLCHFNRITLAKSLEKAGLKLDSVSYISFEHDPYGWIQSILNKLRFRHNRLTILLMRAAKPDIGDLPAFPLVLALLPIAFAISLVSWAGGRGAMLNAVAAAKSAEA